MLPEVLEGPEIVAAIAPATDTRRRVIPLEPESPRNFFYCRVVFPTLR